MKENAVSFFVCSKCGQSFSGSPAISRADSTTRICADCGTREAMESMGVSEAETEKIIETIHSCAVRT